MTIWSLLKKRRVKQNSSGGAGEEVCSPQEQRGNSWNTLLVGGVGQRQLRKVQRRNKEKSGSENQIPSKIFSELGLFSLQE